MSTNDRQAYHRLLAAYSRRLQILATCEKILKLCESSVVDTEEADEREEQMDMMVDDYFAPGYEEVEIDYENEEDADPHYFNRPHTEQETPLEASSLSRLDSCQMFSNSSLRQDITCLPYMGKRARSTLTDRIKIPISLQDGDAVHVPFTSAEMRIVIESAQQYLGVPNCQEVAKRLRGRTARDVRYAWLDYVLNDNQHNTIIDVHDEPTRDRCTSYFNTNKAIQQRSALMLREAEQTGGIRTRINRWISRQGYIHAECTFRLQLEDAINQIVTGPSEDTSHLAVIVGSGNISQGAGPPVALDLRDKSTHPLVGHFGVVNEAAFSSDGRFIITGSDDGTACIFDSNSLNLRHVKPTQRTVVAIGCHKSEPVFAVGLDEANSIVAINAESLTAHSLRLPFEDTVCDMAFGAAGTSVQNHLAVGFKKRTSIYKYQLTSTGLRRLAHQSDENKVFLVRSIPITAAAYASCFFYSTEGDDQLGSDKIKIWDSRSPDITAVTIRSYTKRGRHLIQDMTVSPNGRYLQTSGNDGCVCINDLRKLGSKPLLVLKHQCDIGQPTDGVATEWSRDSRFLVTGADDCTVRIWDMMTNDYESANAGLIRVIDGNAVGEGCIHIVANIHNSTGFIYGSKLGNVVAYEQYQHPIR